MPEIQDDNSLDLTGKNQRGFKGDRSTSKLLLENQSFIGRALDEKKYVLMALLDLSSAFGVAFSLES